MRGCPNGQGRKKQGHRVSPGAPQPALSVPEHVHLLEAGLQGEHVAADLHVAGHGPVINVVGEMQRDAGGLLSEFLGIVG
ncbi:hypothetical protein D3C80_1869300 [compost metagenome]